MNARRGALLAMTLLVLGACDEPASPSEPAAPTPQALLDAAIEAHGGAEALRRLDDLRVRADVVFRDGVELERRVDLRAPSSFAMTLSHAGREVMTFGLAGDRCWRKHGPFALPCEPDDLADQRRTLGVLNARLLHGIDRGAVTDAGYVTVGDVEAPAIRAGDLRLAFHPETHQLLQIDYEDDEHRVERFTVPTEVEGAVVATRRELTIDAEPDVTETWTEIVPGGADAARLVPVEPPEPGDVYDGEEPPRTVAWVDVAALPEPPAGTDTVTHALAALGTFVEERGLRPSGTDGVLVLFPSGGGGRVAAALEVTTRIEDVDAAPFHIETFPARRYVGVYHRGADASSRADALDAAVQARGATVATDAPRELLLFPGAEREPPEERFGLYRVAVEP